jgi:hypothetical protein
MRTRFRKESAAGRVEKRESFIGGTHLPWWNTPRGNVGGVLLSCPIKRKDAGLKHVLRRVSVSFFEVSTRWFPLTSCGVFYRMPISAG